MMYDILQKNGIDLQKLLEQKNNYYRSFRISKGKGRYRYINAPFGILIDVQKICITYLSNKTHLIHPKAKAFRKGISLKHNATPHANSKKVLKIDLKDFFGTITHNMVAEKLGHTIADLVTHRGVLPQGAPTSPIISNIVAYKLDEKMSEWATKHDLTYTRYADDMAFSGNYIPNDYRKELNIIVQSEGFTINKKKTKLLSNNQEQSITGVNVNRNISISKRKCRHNLRAVLYYYGRNNIELTDEIKGMLAYIKSINQSQYKKLVRDYERTRTECT